MSSVMLIITYEFPQAILILLLNCSIVLGIIEIKYMEISTCLHKTFISHVALLHLYYDTHPWWRLKTYVGFGIN